LRELNYIDKTIMEMKAQERSSNPWIIGYSWQDIVFNNFVQIWTSSVIEIVI